MLILLCIIISRLDELEEVNQALQSFSARTSEAGFKRRNTLTSSLAPSLVDKAAFYMNSFMTNKKRTTKYSIARPSMTFNSNFGIHPTTLNVRPALSGNLASVSSNLGFDHSESLGIEEGPQDTNSDPGGLKVNTNVRTRAMSMSLPQNRGLTIPSLQPILGTQLMSSLGLLTLPLIGESKEEEEEEDNDNINEIYNDNNDDPEEINNTTTNNNNNNNSNNSNSNNNSTHSSIHNNNTAEKAAPLNVSSSLVLHTLNTTEEKLVSDFEEKSDVGQEYDKDNDNNKR